MSYYNDRPHYGHRRPRDDYRDLDRRREFEETPEQRLKSTIIKIGEVDALEELNRVAQYIMDSDSPNVPIISEGIRIGLTEQPYKVPYYALFLCRLCYQPVKEEGNSPAALSVGRQVLEDIWKGFQAYLDKLAWRETRLCVHFFAHLTLAKIVTPSSFLALLQSFTAVLDEFGVSHGRAKQAARCAAEGLMRAGHLLKEASPAAVIEIITTIQNYSDQPPDAKWFVHPLSMVHTQDTPDAATEILECAIAALKTLNSADFSEVSSIYIQPYMNAESVGQDLYDLPVVLVPPDAIELEGLATDSVEEAPVKKEEWPEFYLRLFDNAITPDPVTPAGYAARADLLDIVDIFEVNRKECAKLLIEYPKWTLGGTFRPRPGTQGEVLDQTPVVGKDWQLENSIIETILGALFLLPESPHKPIYYTALITELCKLSPQTVGPAVGKSIRKLYSYLSNGLDVDISRRFSEWFSVHMSNFGFQWVWKEWLPDLSLCQHHPKKIFIRKALDMEIRLSYFDRVLKTLPEPMQDPSAGAVPDQAPGPEYDYDDPSTLYHDAAQSVLNQLRSRATPEDMSSLLESLKNTLADISEGEINVEATLRSIAVQSLLHIGSRSFSHFLNAIERYISLLRGLAAGSLGPSSAPPNAVAKADILNIVSTFWRRNRQMIAIVFDKLMQYQIVDPTDVVKWVFVHRERGLDWDILKAAVDKANGRVVIARKKVVALRKEEDETRARAMASNGVEVAGMEVDGEPKEETAFIESPALATALKGVSVLTREQKSTLSAVLDSFLDTLHPANINDAAYQVVMEAAWDNRSEWGDAQWRAWHAWALFKHFARAYAPYMRNFATALSTVSMAKVEGKEDDSAKLLRKIWDTATGQD